MGKRSVAWLAHTAVARWDDMEPTEDMEVGETEAGHVHLRVGECLGWRFMGAFAVAKYL